MEECVTGPKKSEAQTDGEKMMVEERRKWTEGGIEVVPQGPRDKPKAERWTLSSGVEMLPAATATAMGLYKYRHSRHPRSCSLLSHCM
jgi:hypothetical protein